MVLRHNYVIDWNTQKFEIGNIQMAIVVPELIYYFLVKLRILLFIAVQCLNQIHAHDLSNHRSAHVTSQQ